MKSILRKAYVILKGFGYARAAAHQARIGNHSKARQLIDEYCECK